MKYWKYLPLILIAAGLATGCNHSDAAKTAAAADSQATSPTSIPKALPAGDREELNKMLHH